MNQKWGIGLLIVAAACCFVACASPASGSTSQPNSATSVYVPVQPMAKYTNAKDGDPAEHTVEAIKQRGTLIVALVDNNAPFAFFNDDGVSREGLDSSIANTIASDLGVTLELIICTPADAIDAVRSGAADVALGGYFADDSILRAVQPTAFYAGGAQVLLMCIEDTKTHKSMGSFATKTIVNLLGVPQQTDIMKELLPDCAIKPVLTIEAGLKKLRDGTCIALMMDEFQGIAYANDNPDLALSHVPLTTDTLADANVMAVMQENESLLNYINTNILEKYKKTGGLGRLMLSAVEKATNMKLLDEMGKANGKVNKPVASTDDGTMDITGDE